MNANGMKRRTKMTLLIGAISGLAFGGLYGAIAHDPGEGGGTLAAADTVELDKSALLDPDPTVARDDEDDDEEYEEDDDADEDEYEEDDNEDDEDDGNEAEPAQAQGVDTKTRGS